MTPAIRFYAKMELSKYGGKTPKYTITEQAGYFPPIDEIRGKDGKTSFYLMESKQSGTRKGNAPAMKLQAKSSLNFTGLKEYFVNGRLSGYAYGYPNDKATYSKDSKANPFFAYRNDGYLFLIHQDTSDTENAVPVEIEMIVLAGARVLISAYCKSLVKGGFNEDLAELRKLARG